jgi:hypothetical protein
MGVLPADGFPEFQHNGFGTDLTAGQVEIGTHTLRIESQSGKHQTDALERIPGEDRASADRFKSHGGRMVCLLFALHSLECQRY